MGSKWPSELYFSNTIHSPDFIKGTGELANGIIFADLKDSTEESFKKRWKSEFNEDWPGLASGGSIFYDITTEFVNLAGQGVTSSEAIFAKLKQVKSINGVAGVLRFDPEGNLSRKHSLYKIKDAKVLPLDK